jgi:putative membrane protein
MFRNLSRDFIWGSVLAAFSLGTASGAFAQAAKLKEGQILQYVQTVNEGEVRDAKLALSTAKTTEVKDFAKHMLADHSKSQKAIAELAKKAKIDLSTSEVTLTLENEAQAGEKALKSAEGADFDKQYAQAQAKMHAEVATILQSQLMPAATSEAVKCVLSETLTTVQEHQRMAEDLAARL